MRRSSCKIALAAVVVIALGFTPSLHAQVDTDLEVLKRLAEERYAEGDIERSAELYQEIAALCDESSARAEALFLAGWLEFLSGRESKALGLVTDSLALDPGQKFEPSLYTNEFELLYHQALETALGQRRRQATESLAAALNALEGGRSTEARDHLAATLELDPDDPTALYHAARLDLDRIGPTEALTRFERVVALSYRDSDAGASELRAGALTELGHLYRDGQRLDDAEQSYLDATRADPTHAGAWESLGDLYLEREQYSLAANALERLHELRPDDRDTTLRLAAALESSGRGGQAGAMLRTQLQRQPDDAGLWLELADLELRAGQDGEAAFAFDRAYQADPENRKGVAVPAATRLALVHYRQESFAEAVDVARSAVEMDPLAAPAWQALGRSQLELGDLPGAIASLDRAAELATDSIDGQIYLADAYVEAQQLQAAEGAYLRALTIDPSSALAAERLETVRTKLASERAIVNGRAKPRKPIQPKHVGVELKELDYEQLQLRGALVKGINKKSPAARAGLRKGDLILWIGSYSVLSDKDFVQYIKRNPPGDTLEIEYLRDGRIHETVIQLR